LIPPLSETTAAGNWYTHAARSRRGGSGRYRLCREIAKKIAGLDLGQTIVVADRACVAVEAMEGTDAASSVPPR